MKNPFKKVHWGPNIVNVFEPTVFKSSVESRTEEVYVQSTCLRKINSFPSSRYNQCKTKTSFKNGQFRDTGKKSHRARGPTQKSDPKKMFSCCPCAAKTLCHNKKLMEMGNNSMYGAPKCKCCKKRRGERELFVRSKHYSSAAHENCRSAISLKCDKLNSKDKLAKLSKRYINEKPRKRSQKCKSNSRILEKETSARDVSHIVKLTGGENAQCTSSKHGLKIKIWLKPRPCNHCHRH